MADMKAEATTKLGGIKKGPGLKLIGDYKPVGSDKKAGTAARKQV
jgi:hypothetical protein